VTGAGNTVGHPKGYPALFGSPNNRNYIPGLIVAGSVRGNGGRDNRFCEADWLSCYAAGSDVVVPDPVIGYGTNGYDRLKGTSFGKAMSSIVNASTDSCAPSRSSRCRSSRVLPRSRSRTLYVCPRCKGNHNQPVLSTREGPRRGSGCALPARRCLERTSQRTQPSHRVWEFQRKDEETRQGGVPDRVSAVPIVSNIPYRLSVSDLHLRVKVRFAVRRVLLPRQSAATEPRFPRPTQPG
jgi:hypothetical protein